MNESHNVPIPLSGPDPTLSETRVSSDKVRWVEISNNCNFIRIHQPSRTGGNGSRNSAVSMWDINSSLIILLIYGTLCLQQLSLAQVWLFLNEIQPSWRVYYRLSIIACKCILLRWKWPFGPFRFNKLIDWLGPRGCPDFVCSGPARSGWVSVRVVEFGTNYSRSVAGQFSSVLLWTVTSLYAVTNKFVLNRICLITSYSMWSHNHLYRPVWSFCSCLSCFYVFLCFYVLLTLCVVVFFSVTFYWSI